MDEILKGLMSGAGFAGVVLAWHLLVVDKRLRRIEEALDRSTRSDLLRLIASPHVAPEVKDNAQGIMKEIEQAEADRQKPL